MDERSHSQNDSQPQTLTSGRLISSSHDTAPATSGPPHKKRSQRRGAGDVGAGTVHARTPGEERCPLHLICVRATSAPRCSRFTIYQIDGMIGTPSSHDTGDVTQGSSS